MKNPRTLTDTLRGMDRTFRRLALISRRDDLACVPDDDDTLIVVCDWLLWQEMTDSHPYSLFYEAGLRLWPGDDDLDENLFLRANDWVYALGEDGMMFADIPLGKVFTSLMARALINFHRIHRALVPLIERFRPEEIHYVDFRNEISFLDDGARRDLVRTIARDHGVAFVDRSADRSQPEAELFENPIAPARPTPVKDILRVLFGGVFETLSRLRSAAAPGRAVTAIFVNNNVLLPLLNAYDGGPVTPVVNVLSVPKKPALMMHCLRKGVVMARQHRVELNDADRQAVAEIARTIEAAPVPADAGASLRFAIGYAKTEIVAKERLTDAAAEIRSIEAFYDRFRPQRIVIDGVRNVQPRCAVEVAHRRGIGVDYIWHAPLTPQRMKLDALGGDPRTVPAVTRILSWGSINDAWLADVGACQPVVRVGCPLAMRYAGAEVNGGAKDKALVLQYAPIGSDLKGLNENMYLHFVGVIRRLHELGYGSVAYKLHPGPRRWTKAYFKNIAAHFGVTCEILKTEPFGKCVSEADVVIGPIQSGAFFETLAAGRKYVAFLMPPHGMSDAYYTGYPVAATPEDIDRALAQDTAARGRELLDALYGTGSDTDTAAAFWQAQGADVCGHHHQTSAQGA